MTVNDWCIAHDTGVLDTTRTRALLDAYHAVRCFTPAEAAAWRTMLRAAALRFWLPRLYDYHLPRAAAMLTPHDPAHFERILRQRIAQPVPDLVRGAAGCPRFETKHPSIAEERNLLPPEGRQTAENTSGASLQ